MKTEKKQQILLFQKLESECVWEFLLKKMIDQLSELFLIIWSADWLIHAC